MVTRRLQSLMILLVLVAIGAPASGIGQAIGYETISLGQGLSQGMVHDVLQDRDGFLWIATKDGLNRYDGYDFKVFTHDPYDPHSISANNLSCLFEDSRGRLWIGTENRGLNLYVKTSGRFVRILAGREGVPGLSGTRIGRIGEDSAGNILVATVGGGLNVLAVGDDFPADPAALSIRHLALPGNPDILGLALDGKRRAWVGTWHKIFLFDPDRMTFSLAHEGIGFERWCQDGDGALWLGREEAKPRWFDGTRIIELSDFDYRTRGYQIDHQGRLWIALADGLYVLDLNREHPAKGTYRPSVRRPVVQSLLGNLEIDRSGQLWAGTRGFGLIKINPGKPVFHHQGEGNSFSHIVPDPSGTLIRHVFGRNRWMAVHEGIMDTVPLGDLFIHQAPAHLLITRNGVYWGRFFDKGADHTDIEAFDPASGRHRSLTLDGAFDETAPALEDRYGNIWMAGMDGLLVRIDPVTFNVEYYNYHPEASILASGLLSTTLYEDKAGRIWIGSQGGFAIASFNGPRNTDPKFETFANNPTNRNSLNCDYVSCFLEDPGQPDRFMWIATKGGGINKFDYRDSRFVHYNMEDGLPNNVIYGLLPDKAGNIWGSSNKGIFCMSPEGEEYMIRNFSPEDGLQSDEFNSNSFLSLPDGRLLFGGVNGLNVFLPEEVLTEDFQPNVFITKILVNSREVHPDSTSAVLDGTIETARAITLAADQDILTLEFAALDFTSPRHNQYRYQLIGADEAWVDAKTRRTATYLHLRPGHYTFRVQGTNSRGIWSPNVAELAIRVLPPWWRTWWAYAAYILVFGIALRLAFRFYLHRGQLQSRLAFETREAERVKELDAVKTQLYTNITHEFRTPLTIILGMARQAHEKTEGSVRNSLEMIMRNGQNLLRLVNDMLDLSRLDSGKMALQPVRGDVVEFLRYLFESYYSLGASRNIQLHFLSELDRLPFVYDAEKLRQIVSNLLTNAIKFTPAGGHVYFALGLREGDVHGTSLVMKVKDTGIGIAEEKLPYIFDRFYQANAGTTSKNEGSGIGLALTRELIRLMDGEITARSPAPGTTKGTEFTVTLPVLPDDGAPDAAGPQEISAEPTGLPAMAGTTAMTQGAVEDVSVDSPRLLLVEDNADVVAYIAGCLADFSLMVAQDGQEGLDMASAHIPDLIVSDVMMPRMDGFEFCRKLKADERTSHIPIIILTARADLASKLEGIDIGADAYLEKPFYPEELLLRIRKLLELRRLLHHHYRKTAGLNGEITADATPVVEAPPAEDAFILRAREIVERHLANYDFNVEQFCREMLLSHSQLHRKLDALTGLSAVQFIRSIRLRRAKELLEDPERSITAVAFDSGFQDPGYFSRVFKQAFGVTPNEWRMKGKS